MKRNKQSLSQLKNLYQNRNKTDEEILAEFNANTEKLDAESHEKATVSDFLKRMEEDYVMSEMNVNDEKSIEDLIGIYKRIKIVDDKITEILEESETIDSRRLKELGDYLQGLRESRSKIEQDLGITRKARKGSGESSVVDTIEDLKRRAKVLLEKKLNFCYCPACSMLLSTVWFLYPNGGNSLTLTCNRELPSGKICGTKITVTGSELIAKKNRNMEDKLNI